MSKTTYLGLEKPAESEFYRIQHFNDNADIIDKKVHELENKVGSPFIAQTAAQMTDKTRVYVYVGSESGYTKGNWYYHNGSKWISGGVYNSQGVDTDKNLDVEGKAADAKATGDRLSSITEDLDELVKYNISNLIDFDNIEYESRPSDLVVAKTENGIEFSFTASTDLVAFIPVSMETGKKCYFAFDRAYNSQKNVSNIRLFASDKSTTLYAFGNLTEEITNYKYLYANTTNVDMAYIRVWVGANASKKTVVSIENLWAYLEENDGKIHKVVSEEYIKDYVDRIDNDIAKSRVDIAKCVEFTNDLAQYNFENALKLNEITFTSKPNDLEMSFSEDGLHLKGTGTIIAWIPVHLIKGVNYFFKVKHATGTVNGTNTNVRLFETIDSPSYLKEIFRFSNTEYNNIEVRYPSIIDGGYIRIWTQNAYNDIVIDGFWCKEEKYRDADKVLEIKSSALGGSALDVYNVEKHDSVYSISDDIICDYVRGIDFAEELATPLTDFKKDGDLMVHVSTFAIIADVVYMTYYANRTHATETPTEHIARFVYCPMNNMSDKTYIDLQSVGDSFDGKPVSAIYDTILLRKDDNILYLMWTAIVGGVYTRLYRTFNIATGALSAIFENGFKVGNETGKFNITDMTALLTNVKHKSFDGDIGIIQRLTSRVENGTTYYYTGAYCGEWNAIIKSTDLITWEYVSAPTFDCKSQWENTVYMRGDKAWYFLRQLSTEPCGILAYYDVVNDEWSKPIYVYDSQSRSDFFVRYGDLYLVHAPKNRGYLSVMRIDEAYPHKSFEVQTAKVNDCFYPYVQEYNGKLYISFTQSRQHIWLCEFNLMKKTNDEIRTKISQLLN